MPLKKIVTTQLQLTNDDPNCGWTIGIDISYPETFFGLYWADKDTPTHVFECPTHEYLEATETLRQKYPAGNLIMAVTKCLGFEERGGGPKGIYYTHSEIEGEFLFSQLGEAINLWIMHHKLKNQQ